MYDQAFYRNLAPVLDAQQFSNNPDLYTDPGHFNRSGTDLVMQWLRGSMNPYLDPLSNQTSSLKQMPSYH